MNLSSKLFPNFFLTIQKSIPRPLIHPKPLTTPLIVLFCFQFSLEIYIPICMRVQAPQAFWKHFSIIWRGKKVVRNGNSKENVQVPHNRSILHGWGLSCYQVLLLISVLMIVLVLNVYMFDWQIKTATMNVRFPCLSISEILSLLLLIMRIIVNGLTFLMMENLIRKWIFINEEFCWWNLSQLD